MFYHRPLGDGEDVIRLLQINSSLRGDGSVTCDLVQVPLSTAPGYYALSYRWPARCKKEEMVTILINGQTFEVHPEVESILKDLRWRIGVLMLWIDQICINQTDETEKGCQIALMGRIYTGCVRMYACIPGQDLNSHGLHSELRGMGGGSGTTPRRTCIAHRPCLFGFGTRATFTTILPQHRWTVGVRLATGKNGSLSTTFFLSHGFLVSR